MGSADIYRQEIIQYTTLLTSELKARFYSDLFSHLDLSDFPDNVAKTGRKGFSNHAKLRAVIVMKCECFSCITDLLIAHYCGFNIVKPMPLYWTLDRFINSLYNDLLQNLMHSQVKNVNFVLLLERCQPFSISRVPDDKKLSLAGCTEFLPPSFLFGEA